MTKNLPRKRPTAEKIAPTWTATQLTMSLGGESVERTVEREPPKQAFADSSGQTAERSRTDDQAVALTDKAASVNGDSSGQTAERSRTDDQAVALTDKAASVNGDSSGQTAECSRTDDQAVALTDKAASLAGDVQPSAREVADEIDVLAFLTCVLNGSVADAQLKDRFKAAELLGAHYGLFDKGASGSAGFAPVAVIDDIAREVSG